MGKKMKAWRIEELGKMPVLKEVGIPSPKSGEVLVKMAGAGLCHTDLLIVDDGVEVGPFRGEFTLGHENAGYVAELGEGVTNLTVGDPVVISCTHSCGVCEYCLTGNDNYCTLVKNSSRGINEDGGLAEYVIVPAREVVPLGNVDPTVGCALSDAGLTSFAAVDCCKNYIPANGYTLVIGVGGLGSYAVQYLKLMTGGKVIVANRSDAKLKFAKELGADYAIKSDKNTAEEIMKLTNGRGVDACIDFVGNNASFTLAAKVTKSVGTIVINGITNDALPVAFGRINGGVRVMVSEGGTINHLRQAVALAQTGELRMDVTHYNFEDLPKALSDLRDGKIVGRVVIKFK